LVLASAGQGSTFTSTDQSILQCVMNVGELIFVWLILISIRPRDLEAAILISTTETFEEIDASLVNQEARLAIDKTAQGCRHGLKAKRNVIVPSGIGFDASRAKNLKWRPLICLSAVITSRIAMNVNLMTWKSLGQLEPEEFREADNAHVLGNKLV
jgi:hypothetical protein